MTEIQDEETPVTTTLFTAADRCDRCGAQAHVVALLRGGILLFCRHHGHEHWGALEASGAAMEED